MNNETPITPKRATLARDFLASRRCNATLNSRSTTGGNNITGLPAANLTQPRRFGLVGGSLTGLGPLSPGQDTISGKRREPILWEARLGGGLSRGYYILGLLIGIEATKALAKAALLGNLNAKHALEQFAIAPGFEKLSVE